MSSFPCNRAKRSLIAPENPPAFPTLGSVAYNSDWQTEHGMTLRDWFAGRAMQAQVGAHLSLDSGNYLDGKGMKGLAEEAYAIADAMLAARTPHSTEER